MKLDDLIASFVDDEKAQYQGLCKQANQPDVDRGAVSEALQALVAAVFEREGKEGHAGPLLGQFWGRFKKKKAKKQKVQALSPRLLSAQLPYPLGYKLREFSIEYEKFDKGYGSSNYPFLIASLNGLALRFVAAVMILEYVECLEAPDAKLNELIVEGLQMPADGTWKEMIDVLGKELQEDERLSLLPLLHEALKERRAFEGLKKGIAPASIFQELVSFRNQLLHGTHEFSNEELREASKKIFLLYDALSLFCKMRLVVRGEGGFFDCTGVSPVWVSLTEEERNKQGNASLESLSYDAPYLLPRFDAIEKSEGGKEDETEGPLRGMKALSLFPLVHFFCREEGDEELDELFFFNGTHDEQLEYISYRYARSLDHRELELPYTQFVQFLRKIPVTLLPQKVKLDFLGVARFHRDNFVGRKAVVAAIWDFMEHRPMPYGVIKALAGMGKTALLAHFYDSFRRERGWPQTLYPVWHFCSSAEGRNHPVVFLRSVLAQIDSFFGGMHQEYPTSQELLLRQFEKRLGEVAASMSEGERLVLIVDALDEGMNPAGGLSIPNILPPAAKMPPQVSVLVSYRVDDSGRNEKVEALLPAPEAMTHVIPGCDPLRGLTQEEMREMIVRVADDERVPEDTLRAIWSTARQKGQAEESADPFVLRFICDGLREDTVDPQRPESVPRSLNALFDQFWNQLPTQHNYFLHRLLGMLAMMPDLGSDEMFAQIFSLQARASGSRPVTRDDVAERRLAINKLLVFSGDFYRLFHGRFRDYVRRRFHPKDEALQLLLPLYEFCRSKGSDKRQYALRYRVFHLEKLALHRALSPSLQGQFREDLWQLLEQETFFVQKFEVLQRTDLILEDFLRSFSVFRPREGAQDAWEQFARSYHLCRRANVLLSAAMQKSRERLYHYACNGDLEQVIRIVLLGESAHRRLWSLLLAAVWVKEAGHDPARLFYILADLGTPELTSAELPFLLQLLQRAGGRKGVREQLNAWTPS